MTLEKLRTIVSKDLGLVPRLERNKLTIRNRYTNTVHEVEGKNVHVISNRDLNDISEFVRNWK